MIPYVLPGNTPEHRISNNLKAPPDVAPISTLPTKYKFTTE